MVTVKTISRVRHAYAVKRHVVKWIARDFRLSRNTIRTIVRGEETEHVFRRQDLPLPQAGPFAVRLDEVLAEYVTKSTRQRLTFRRIYEALRLEGHSRGYDAVRRYGRT